MINYTTAAYWIIGTIFFLMLVKCYMNGGVNKHKPDLSSNIVVVTGANTGLGFESVKYMVKLNP